MRAGLNIVVAGGTQAGKTTMLNCLAAAHPRRRAGGLAPRRSSSCGSRTPTGCAMQTRQRGPRGHRRDPAARPGQGEPADAAEPDHRRRGARRGVPRPAAGAQRRAARAWRRSTPTAPARRWSRCARCRCWPGENISARFVVPTVASSVDLVVHLGIDPHGVRRVNEIVGGPGPGRERRHRDRADLRARPAASCVRASGMPPRPERYERVGIDVHAHPERGRADGRAGRARRRRRAAAGLVGVLPCRAAPRAERRRPGRRRRAARPAPGSGQVSVGRLRGRCASVCGVVVATVAMQVVSRTPPVAVAFGVMARLPARSRCVARPGPPPAARASPRSGPRPSTTSPPRCGPGMSLPEALAASGVRGPEPLREAVRRRSRSTTR